ncbi:hypothetical protein B566_EDAN011174 [Ephemera danica]|nr:hypothetical protein B566_EDAN011174 [Ephemera danica]
MLSSFLVLLVLGFLATSLASQQILNTAVNLCENSELATQLSVCDNDLHQLRKQRERAKATAHKLLFQYWRLNLIKSNLEKEVQILRHQVDKPNEPLPRVYVGSIEIEPISAEYDINSVEVERRVAASKH